MFKLLILFPLAVISGIFVLGVALPLLLVVPIFLALALPLLVLRLGVGLLCGLGHVFVGLIGMGFVLTGAVVVLVIGVATAHLLVPIALFAALIWLLRRAARGTPTVLEHHAI